ncbi:hypothetical protein L3X38_040239 [Prunus dulcis]|nr:hypothetical protein L3X38_040239 [Prunus dulcis]
MGPIKTEPKFTQSSHPAYTSPFRNITDLRFCLDNSLQKFSGLNDFCGRSMKGEVQLEPAGETERDPTDVDPLLENQEDSSPGSSTEIYNEDLESGSIPCCRICLESDAEPGDELISPCMCKGTQQFVHSSCLDHWRSVKEGFAFSHCTTCKAQFHLRVESYEDNSWRKIKFRVFVARDVFLVFLAVQSVIAAIGGFAYVMDKDGAFRNSFSDGWDRILSKHPIPFYYCIEDLAETLSHPDQEGTHKGVHSGGSSWMLYPTKIGSRT